MLELPKKMADGTPARYSTRSATATPKPFRKSEAARSPSPAGRAASPLKASKQLGFFQRHGNVYIYVPNLIGYARIIATGAALHYASVAPRLTLMLYLFSFICDELDGRFARKFNQSTTFGAVLDMVTDRLSTTGLCIILAVQIPEHSHFFLWAVLLDIGAHWVQMYAALSSKAASHKDVAAASNPLLRLYYQNRIFMGALCIGAELFYLALFALSNSECKRFFAQQPELAAMPSALAKRCPQLLRGLMGDKVLSVADAVALLGLPLWALKQATNVLQLQYSAQRLAAADSKRSA